MTDRTNHAASLRTALLNAKGSTQQEEGRLVSTSIATGREKEAVLRQCGTACDGAKALRASTVHMGITVLAKDSLTPGSRLYKPHRLRRRPLISRTTEWLLRTYGTGMTVHGVRATSGRIP